MIKTVDSDQQQPRPATKANSDWRLVTATAGSSDSDQRQCQQ